MKTIISTNPILNVQFDSVYINPGLEYILQALEELENRQKVLLVFENDLQRNDQFIVTRTFPFSLFEIPVLKRQFNLLKSLIKIAPHLFQSHKILYINKNKSIKTTALLADFLYKNTYQKKMEIFMPEQIEKFVPIQKNNRKGIYFQEYRYNISRLIIELLKFFESLGGSVKINCQVSTEMNKLTFLQTNQTFTVEKISNCTTKKTPNYLFPEVQFPDIPLVYRDSRITFRYTSLQKKLMAEPLNPISEKASQKELLALTHGLFLPKIEKIIKTERIEDPTTETLKKLAELIKLPLGCSFDKKDLKDMHEQSLEKFDLAKQTDISYPEFKILFHRYGAGIDEIIEDAYSTMNKIRDPEKIWNLAEKNYQKKYEWGN
jgi:hypothetical protein